MKKSSFIMPTLKFVKTSGSFSYDYMMKSGMIRQISAGIFTWLPLGIKILNKLSRFIEKKMEQANIATFLSPTLHPSSLWIQSERYNAYGKETLRMKDRHNNELIYGPTAEEIATEVFKSAISSYKQLPIVINQISWKFRDEIRPRYGVMRSREFLMQDAYSFDSSKENAKMTYKKIYSLYMNIFQSLDLTVIACKADSGQIGGDLCHEFNIISKTGESTIFFDKKILSTDRTNFDKVQDIYAVTEDKHDAINKDIEKAKAIEVGHIFYFGTKYSHKMKANFHNAKNEIKYAEMGSYGIGVSRLLASIIELQQESLIFPKALQPFDLVILDLKIQSQIANNIYEDLIKNDFDVLIDDTEDSFGVKIQNAELMGIRYVLIVGKQIELRDRKNNSNEVIKTAKDITQYLKI